MYFHLSNTWLLELATNMISFFILEVSTLHFFPFHHKHQRTYIRACFLCIYALFTIVNGDSDIILQIICIFVDYTYLLMISSFHWKKSLWFYVKYFVIYQIAYFIISFIHGLILGFIAGYSHVNLDLTIYFSEELLIYQLSIYVIIIFFILNHYLYMKRMKHLQQKVLFPHIFIVVSIACVYTLFFCVNYIVQEKLAHTFMFIYVFIYSILLFLSYNYSRMITLIEATVTQRTQLEKYNMERNYIENIDTSIKTLSKIRHDFKNQLIILDNYAEHNEHEKLRAYIRKMNEEIGATKLYTTPNDLISAILNAKNTICIKKNITLRVSCQFRDIYLDDFSIITILGNLLDNAITAAAKTEHGYIEVSFTQLGAMLEITCKNNHCEILQKRKGLFITTKKHDLSNHGIGLKNIKECIEQLHGTLQFSHDVDTFLVSILIPNF